MHIAFGDLGIEHLWVVYPGSVRHPLTDRNTALPLVEANEIAFQQRQRGNTPLPDGELHGDAH